MFNVQNKGQNEQPTSFEFISECLKMFILKKKTGKKLQT